MGTYFIVGANRGIGLEFVKQLGSIPENTIIATVRKGADLSGIESLNYSNIKLVYIDMQDPLEKFIEVFSDDTLAPNGIDVLFFNAAWGTIETIKPLHEQNYDHFEKSFQINTLGPLKLYKAIFPKLEKNGRLCKLIFLSSTASIISNMEVPCGSYGISKAGVNYLAKQISVERKDKGDIVIAIHPGVVDTDMSKDFRGQDFYHPITTTESVTLMSTVIKSLKPEDSGKFFNNDGTVLPF